MTKKLLILFLFCITTAFASWGLHSKSKIDAPAPGGTYKEGIISEVNNLNPLFASSNFDAAADQLIFSGLLKYDTEGKLGGDLARSWQASKDGKTCSVKLRDDVRWHDGEPFTAKDVSLSLSLAVKSGAELIAAPEEKPWGQTVAYVRDFNGILIEIASDMAGCASDNCCCH